jgi:hypothetical protein
MLCGTASLALALMIAGCSKKATQPQAAAPTTTSDSLVPGELPSKRPLILPLGLEDPTFSQRWRETLLRIPSDDPLLPAPYADVSVSNTPIPSERRLSTDAWMNEAGAIYRLGLAAGSGLQDMRSWTRVLQETLTLLETPQPVPPYRSSLKLFTALSGVIDKTRYAPMNRYVEIEAATQSSPLAREACESFRKWFSTRQLLAGRSVRALNRSKESVVLHCQLIGWEEGPKTLPFLQIAEMPLPLIEPERQELLFRNGADLVRPDRLQLLRAIDSSQNTP